MKVREQALRTIWITRWQVALTLVFVVAGFLVVTQIRNELLIRQQLRVPSQRLEELAFVLHEQERQREALERQIVVLRDQVRAYEVGTLQGRTKLTQLGMQLDQLRLFAGFTAVEGPGVQIELRDSPNRLRPGDDPNTVILHYTDLQAVANELFASGAEALAINGERVVATTGLNCVGTTILCNIKRVAPPYRLVAIGPVDAMMAYLQRPSGAVETLRAFGFPVELVRGAHLTVPAYRGSYRFTFARPAR
ncbi:MAG TPA: DUF881 domain-containing protein [bacterium]|jgi:uncharacterized protein YlxW (UPF0749 family)